MATSFVGTPKCPHGILGKSLSNLHGRVIGAELCGQQVTMGLDSIELSGGIGANILI